MTDEAAELENVDLPEEEEATEEAPEAKEKSNLQSRFDKITREKYEAMNERDQLKKEAEELRKKLEEAPPPPEPTLEQHDYDEDAYNEALIASRVQAEVDKAIKAQQQSSQSQQAQQEAAQKSQAFAAKEAEFAKEVPDYDQVARTDAVPISEAMADIIMDSDKGPAIAYHLGKNLNDAYRISQLPPVLAAKELFKIEASLAQPANISNAPEPAPEIGGMDTPVQELSDKLSTEEWIKRRNRQVHGN